MIFPLVQIIIFEKPFLYLARKLVGNQSLNFVEAPALQPPETSVDPELVKQWENEAVIASSTALPEDDDDQF